MKEHATKIIAIVASLAAIVLAVVLISQDGDDDDDSLEAATPAAQVDQVDADDSVQDGDDVVTDDTPADDTVTDADDQPISQSDSKAVTNAALDIAGGGTVTDLDRSDDPGEAWEVEVTMDDGSELDVALDEQLNRVQNTSYDD